MVWAEFQETDDLRAKTVQVPVALIETTISKDFSIPVSLLSFVMIPAKTLFSPQAMGSLSESLMSITAQPYRLW
jgi:hypothetical protein